MSALICNNNVHVVRNTDTGPFNASNDQTTFMYSAAEKTKFCQFAGVQRSPITSDSEVGQ